MTDPIYMRMAEEAREQIGCEEVYIVAVQYGMVHVASASDDPDGAEVTERDITNAVLDSLGVRAERVGRPDDPTCATCPAFHLPEVGGSGTCRMSAPVMGRWPLVSRLDWCMEHPRRRGWAR